MQSAPKTKLVIIVGTTASGKSSLAVALAHAFNGEIISADSRQVYRKLDIGTAKLTKDEMQGIPHHLIDVADLSSTYTAVDFKNQAHEAIKQIAGRGNLPIITGGTFFYIDALLERSSLPEVPPNSALRTELEALTNTELLKRLQKLDQRRANTIDPQNKRRLVRALEIAHALGSVPEVAPKEPPYEVLMLGLVAQKEELRKRFESRARTWLQNGFTNEVRALLDSGIERERLHEMGFEYQLGLELQDGTLTEEAFVQKFIEKNWQYAKRQLTWLKRDGSVVWVYPEEGSEIKLLIENFLRN